MEILQTQQCLTNDSSDDCFVLDSLGEVELQNVTAGASAENGHDKPQISALDERHITADYVLVLASAHYTDLLTDFIYAIVLELLKINNFNRYIASVEAGCECFSLPNEAEGAHADGND